MITTQISATPVSLTPDQVEFARRENFITFGRLLSDEELANARFAYERVWDQHPFVPESKRYLIGVDDT